MRVKYNRDTMISLQVTGPTNAGAAALLHNAMYEYANLNAVDLHVTCEKGQLRHVVDACRHLHMIGLNVAKPHKSDIIDFLDEVDPISKAFKCCNTVVNDNGRLYGKGMDGVGMGMAIELRTGSVKGKRVFIIGAGACGGLIPAYLCQQGASGVVIANRTVSKAEYVAQTLTDHFGVSTEAGPLTEDFMRKAASEAQVIVQCSSMGNAGFPDDNFASLDFVNYLPDGCVAADVSYPTTPFLEAAKARGLSVVPGDGMLYFQQLAIMKLRFGIELPIESMYEARETVAIGVAMRDLRDKSLGIIKM